MKKEGVILLFAVLFAFGFLSLVSAATNITVTPVSVGYSQVNIVSASNLYSYEVNFDYTGSIDNYDDAGFLGSDGGAVAGVNYNEKNGVVSFYDSRLDNTKEGISGSGNLFNITFTGNLTLRSALFVDNQANETSVSFVNTYCGDKVCDESETCSNCATDCGACPVASNPSSGGGGSSGGGSIVVTKVQTYTASEAQVASGYSQELASNEVIQFVVGNTQHFLTVLSVNDSSASYELESAPSFFSLNVGESREFYVNGDDNYKVKITLESVSGGKARTTILRTGQPSLNVNPENPQNGAGSILSKNITKIVDSSIVWPIIAAVILTGILVFALIWFVILPRSRRKSVKLNR